MNCNIYKEVKNIGLTEKDIVSIIKTTMDFLKKKNPEISVHLIGDKKIKGINKNYRGKNKVTDVLAFAMQPSCLPAGRQALKAMAGKEGFDGQIGKRNNDLGDIFISIPQVKRQAKEQKISYKEELARILVHGILHLNEYDHMNEKEKKEMFGLQEKMVKKIMYEF